MKVLKTKFKGLVVFKNRSFKDKRGYFRELLRENNLKISVFSNVTLQKECSKRIAFTKK